MVCCGKDHAHSNSSFSTGFGSVTLKEPTSISRLSFSTATALLEEVNEYSLNAVVNLTYCLSALAANIPVTSIVEEVVISLRDSNFSLCLYELIG